MRVLVTGGAGFIGSHLTDALLARGDEVAVVDDLSAGRPGRLDERATLHKLSVTAAGALTALITELAPELICHLAAQIDVRASVAAPAADAQANVVGTVNVLEAARAAGARVLFCSTGGALYGRDAPIPSMEDVLPLPESPYGVAKHCAEQYVGLYNRLHGTAHTVLRFANVYGPRQDPERRVRGRAHLLLPAAGRRPADHLRRRQPDPRLRLRGRRRGRVPGRRRPRAAGHLEHRQRPRGERAGAGPGHRRRSPGARSSRGSTRPGPASCSAARWPSRRPSGTWTGGRAPR